MLKPGPLVLGRFAAQGLLAFAFLSAGLDKLLISGPGVTGGTLASLGFGGPPTTTVMGALVGAAEVALGLWLACGWLPSTSALLAALANRSSQRGIAIARIPNRLVATVRLRRTSPGV